jgi:hypothetical protein
MSSDNPQQNQPKNSPEKYRPVLVVSGVVLGIIVAYLFSTFYKAPVKSLDLIFWAIGGGLLGLSASLPTRPRTPPQ